MFIRTLLTAFLIICSFFISGTPGFGLTASGLTVSGIAANQTPAAPAALQEPCQGCTYERVFIEGQWWIIVYAPDGSIIDIYPDEDD